MVLNRDPECRYVPFCADLMPFTDVARVNLELVERRVVQEGAAVPYGRDPVLPVQAGQVDASQGRRPPGRGDEMTMSSGGVVAVMMVITVLAAILAAILVAVITAFLTWLASKRARPRSWPAVPPSFPTSALPMSANADSGRSGRRCSMRSCGSMIPNSSGGSWTPPRQLGDHQAAA
jgi:Flp pilus assembly protein TadB